mgnify:CR=1 FL=1
MELTHFDEHGNARMVDVSKKDITSRSACAVGSILVNKEIVEKIEHSDMKKGDVLGVARIAGIMGVKKTSDFRFWIVIFAAFRKNIGNLLINSPFAGTDGAHPFQ